MLQKQLACPCQASVAADEAPSPNFYIFWCFAQSARTQSALEPKSQPGYRTAGSSHWSGDTARQPATNLRQQTNSQQPVPSRNFGLLHPRCLPWPQTTMPPGGDRSLTNSQQHQCHSKHLLTDKIRHARRARCFVPEKHLEGGHRHRDPVEHAKSQSINLDRAMHSSSPHRPACLPAEDTRSKTS